MFRPIMLSLSAALLFPLALGCLKRGEAIVVRQDGSIRMLVSFEGDPDDLRTGDPLPSRESGWDVKEETTKDQNGKEQLTVMAERSFPAGQSMPTSYAVAGSPQEPWALKFNTAVRVEQRAEGTYYHFRRVFHARPAARIVYFRKEILETDAVKDLIEKDPASLTDEERQRYVSAMIQFEQAKTRTFVDEAAGVLGDDLKQDLWLAAREQAGKPYEADSLLQRSMAALAEKEHPGDEIERIDNDILQQVEKGMREALMKARTPKATMDRFLDAYRLARSSFEVTEDLSDEQWEVVVEMPGRIIATNRTSGGLAPEEKSADDKAPGSKHKDMIDEARAHEFTAGPNRCGWEFSGEELRDYDVVLAATSFVARQ